MEALGHFIFELFKIAILSVAYAGVLFWVGAVPVVGIFLLPLVVETKGRELMD